MGMDIVQSDAPIAVLFLRNGKSRRKKGSKMSKYIDCEKAIKELYDTYERKFPTGSGAFDLYASRIVPRVLRNMADEEVEPVIHCENCAHAMFFREEYGNIVYCPLLCNIEGKKGYCEQAVSRNAATDMGR